MALGHVMFVANSFFGRMEVLQRLAATCFKGWLSFDDIDLVGLAISTEEMLGWSASTKTPP